MVVGGAALITMQNGGGLTTLCLVIGIPLFYALINFILKKVYK